MDEKDLKVNETTEYYFNKKPKTSNSIKNVSFGLTKQVIQLVGNFVYRTIFLMVLTTNYLGLKGLFTNILSFLSLAELGIGFSIVYRMYAPIANNDIGLVASYMRFFRKVYSIIGLIVFVVGMALMPTIKFMIKDLSEIPPDINIYLIYFLYLLQSVSSYFMVSRASIFTTDQKNYYLDISNSICIVVSNCVRITLLFLTKNFTLILAVEILITLINNVILSLLAKKQYPLVFKKCEELSKERKVELGKDVGGMLCHKIGDILVTSTDNILISMFIGLSAVGMYSNYSMIISAIIVLMSQIIATQTAGIGMSRLQKTKEDYFKLYKKLLFVNTFMSSFTSIALFSLLNPFITVWLNADMLMGMDFVIVLSINYFFKQMRQVNTTFINASGLFKIDKWRPFVEAFVNLASSIILVYFLGIVGILLGTIISNVCVVIWRESYLLHKREFGAKQTYFYLLNLFFFAISIALSAGLYYLFKLIPNNLGYLLLKFLIAGVVPMLVLLLLTFWIPECKFFINKIKGMFKSIYRKIVRRKS